MSWETQTRKTNASGEDGGESTGRGNPFAHVFPPHPLVWREARRLASNRNARVEDLALCASQDPVLVIELLRMANAVSLSGERRVISTTASAIVRLGSQIVTETLEGIIDRPQCEDPEIRRVFEAQRNRCKRAAIISRLLAELAAKQVADDCQTAGLFVFVGELLAVAHFGSLYVKLFDNGSPASANSRLANDFKFDVEKAGLTYLQRQGIPDIVISALDREGRTRQADRAIMKPVCFAAAEVIDAFDTNRWEKLSPGRQLPPKSALRSLQLNENAYLRFYERASEYLFHERTAQAKITLKDLDAVDTSDVVSPEVERPAPVTRSANASVNADFNEKLEAEIQQLLSVTEPRTERESPKAPATIKAVTKTLELNEETKQDLFSLTPSTPKTTARVQQTKSLIAPPPLRTEAGNSFVTDVQKRLDSHSSSEDLLRDILGILTEDGGPFEKSALIVVSKTRSSALVVAARGPQITCGQTLVLDDPLSPLAQCFSKVQSFGSRSSKESPWGSKAFALSPIDADHDTPVALYADCGESGSITFEARRIFRAVVDILNQKLPTIPGGIPVEV